MKKKTVLLLAACMTAAFLSGCGVKQTKDTVKVEAGQELELQATDFFDIREDKAGEITFDASAVDTGKTGEYDVIASYKKETFTIKVIVEDTTAPSVELKQRYVFTNDAAACDPEQLVEGIYDASGYSLAFTRFEKTGNLDVMDDTALKALTDTIPLPCDQAAMAELGTEDIPQEEGIYRTVLAATDDYGNTRLEEVYLILDKTGALIEDVEDKIIEVEAKYLDQDPEIDPSEYVVTDNVDGAIKAENITCEVELTDADNLHYTVHVSYTDRAGNESKADFLITVKEKKEESSNASDKGNGSDKNSNSGSGSSTGGNSSGSGSGSGGSSDGGSGDGGSSSEDPNAGVTAYQQIAINAGYYNVVSDGNGGYMVMVPEAEADYGFQLLRDYLAAMGCDASQMSGGWISSANDQYLCSVGGDHIHEIDNSGNEW